MAPMYVLIPLRQCEERGVQVLSIFNIVQVGHHTRRFAWIATYHTRLPHQQHLVTCRAVRDRSASGEYKGRATSYSLKLVVYLVILHRIMTQGVENSADFWQ
jgi:hypothetical protein